MRFLALALSFVSAVTATACSAAYADQPGGRNQMVVASPRTALAIAPERIRAPFDVTLIGEDGAAMPTFASNGRYYVLGDAGDRYIIRIANPTPNRVEAVVTVDGLDVIDGEGGDLGKRGYIVPPYGDLRIEGFRTSSSDVATFRFSSVDGSYAGKKGKARNVGVIAVALFEEQAAQEVVEQQQVAATRDGRRNPYDFEDDLATSSAGESHRTVNRAPTVSQAPAAKLKRPAPTAPMDEERGEAEAPAAPPSGGAAAPTYRPSPPPTKSESAPCCDSAPVPQRRERLGLGTEFGEQRYSAASYTRFVRAPGKPIAIAELRYNDRPGLTALGITVAPAPDENEIMMRETADPFPGDRFARPPTP